MTPKQQTVRSFQVAVFVLTAYLQVWSNKLAKALVPGTTVSLLSNPSKMPGKAFGLPAHRACPRKKGTICDSCYASKGCYSWKGPKHAQQVRFEWTRDCMRTDEGMRLWVSVERWHNEVVLRQHSPKTAERSHELAQYAIRLFGDTPLDQLTTAQLTTDMNRLLDHGGRVTKQHPKGRPLAPKTVRHIAFGVQACLNQAVDWDILVKNVMKKVKKPRVPKRRPRIVDRDGFSALLLKTAGFAVYPVIMLANATGMRRGELCALEWTDLDWDKGTIEVSKSLEETKQGLRIKPPKSGEPRKEPLSIPGDVLEVLRDHKREQDYHRELYGSDYANLNLVFARPDGHYYNPDKLGRRIVVAMKSAGLAGVSLHSLRHSHASELLSKGAPITAVSERLGHASPNITLGIYSHALPADNAAAAKLWNDAMSGVIQESRKQAAKNRMSSNVIKGEKEKSVIPIKSAS